MHIWRALGFSHPQHAQLLGTAAQLPWQLWLAASRPPGKRAGGPRRGVAAAGHRPTWHMHQLIATCDSVLRRRAATSPITSSSGCSPGSTCLQVRRAGWLAGQRSVQGWRRDARRQLAIEWLPAGDSHTRSGPEGRAQLA